MQFNNISDNAWLFAMDVPDITITGATGPVTVRISISGSEETYEEDELYYCDDTGSINIEGIGQMAMDYIGVIQGRAMSAGKNDISNYAMVVLTAYGSDGEAAATKSFYVQYAREEISSADVSGYNGFLNRFKSRRITSDQNIYFAVVGSKNIRLEVGYKNQSNELATGYTTLTSTGSKKTSVYKYSLANLITALNINPKEIYYVVATSSYDEIKWVIDDTYKKNIELFEFDNLFGIPESMAFRGSTVRTSEMEGSYSIINLKYQKRRTDITTKFKAYTGAISEDERNTVEDIITADFVTVNGMEATVLECEVEDKTARKEPITASVTYRYAGIYSRRYVRRTQIAHANAGVFDATFDDTYE